MAVSSFFDVNGFIGRGVFGDSEYPDPDDLLAQMDYLGIDRALVWDLEARDAAVFLGNKRLLEKLSAKKKCRERLFPAFTVTPAIVFDSKSLAFLKKSLKSGAVRALRIFPASCRFNLATIERLFHEIKSSAPVVLWDFKDSLGWTDKEAMASLAAKFPRFNFVLTELMWGQFNDALDLMWRAKNILCDISWLHMTDAIEILVEHFGAGRVVFGRGFKSHYGASMAALAHSTISASDKEMIAHGNIERLLGLKSPARRLFSETGADAGKPLWRDFKAGRAVSGAEIIDSHGHSGSSVLGWTFRTSDVGEMFAQMVGRMDALGVSRTLVSHFNALYGDPLAENRAFEEFFKREKNPRILGYYSYNPHYKDALVPEFDKRFAGGFFVGFKLLPSYWKTPLTDPRFEPVWSYAHKHRLPILVHTWDDRYNPPSMLRDIAKKYKRAVFLLGHSGGGTAGRKEAVELALENRNVFLEYCGSFTTPVDWADTFREVGFDRVVFGSDTYAHDQAWELGRLLSTPVPDEDLAPVLAGNIRRILASSGLKIRA